MATTRIINPKKKTGKALTSVDVQNKLLGLGCDPVEIIAGIAMSEKSDESLKLNAAKELMGYMYSKQRSVDINAEVTQTNVFAQVNSDSAFKALRDLTGKSMKTIDIAAEEKEKEKLDLIGES